MKKIVKLSLVLLVAIIMVGSTAYAALECNVSINTTKTEYSKNEEFVVNVDLSSIQSERGVIAFGATLDYDKDSLTLVKMEGKNGWSNPSYNESNGKMVMDRSNVTNNDETVLAITFKVNENTKQNITITLKDISVSDGTTPIKQISSINKNITIKEETTTPDSGSNSDVNTDNNQNTNNNQTTGTTENTNTTTTITTNTNTNTSDNKNQISNNNTNSTNTNKNTTTNTTTTTITTDSSVSTEKLPQTGTNNTIIVLLIIAVSAVAFFSVKLIKIRNV
jgi:LPXTG-motif cell wall-anchored protein